jgi:prepilin-type processing-associated H-X9-DG protein
MPIAFTCPHCGVETAVAEQFAGRSGPCANCGRAIDVPPAGAESGGAAVGNSLRVLPLVMVGACALAAMVVCGGILVKLLMPAVLSTRQAAHKTQCAHNLQQIASAVFQYRVHYDTFPPACIADQTGKPLHSWRVLILPFLGHQALYDRYDFGQPWDSPDNLALAEMIPEVYRCPADSTAGSSQTSYLMIVGPGTFSSVTGPLRHDEMPDGPVGTLMLVETLNSGIVWTQPQDFHAGRSSTQINAPTGPAIGSRHPGGANAAMGDGSVQFLSEWTTPEDVRAMTTVDGGETISRD